MARKKVTEEAVPEIQGKDTLYDAPPAKVKKAKTVVEAAEIYAKAKRADKAEAQLLKLTDKHAKLGETVESIKKQISDLKNLNAANYKNGFDKGFEKGYAQGAAETRKAIIAAIKG